MMNVAVDMARCGMNKNYGGPFGALIVKDDKVIAVACNTVIKDNDATAHAEINAIREASHVLGTYDLSGCVLYATGYPCPMCLSAIMWASIDTVYYGTLLSDAAEIGFKDDFIYDFIRNNNKGDTLKLIQLDRDICVKLFEEYDKSGKIIY